MDWIEWIACLEPENQAVANTLRAIILAAAPSLVQRARGDAAAAFSDGKVDLISLDVKDTGELRATLRRSQTQVGAADARAMDVDGLAVWPTADHGEMAFRAVDDVIDRTPALFRLFRRWVDQGARA